MFHIYISFFGNCLQVFEKGTERGDFLNYLVDAMDASSKRTDKMMTGYWLSIAAYIYRALRTEFGYSGPNAAKSGSGNKGGGAVAEFASRLQIVIAGIFERLLTSLYTVFLFILLLLLLFIIIIIHYYV
jgi:hypothetical protein